MYFTRFTLTIKSRPFLEENTLPMRMANGCGFDKIEKLKYQHN